VWERGSVPIEMGLEMLRRCDEIPEESFTFRILDGLVFLDCSWDECLV